MIITKTINLNGSSMVGNVQVACFSANISGNRSSNISNSILDKSLYEANKTLVRNDFDEFCVKVYEIEDEMQATTIDTDTETVVE